MRLPICGHRGALGEDGKYFCDSPKLLPKPGYRTGDFCEKTCPYHDNAPKHESRAPVPAPQPKPRENHCQYLGRAVRDEHGKPLLQICPPCQGKEWPLFDCMAGHGQVSHQIQCQQCPDYGEKQMMRWAYGVTTIPRRRDTLLPRTLASLKAAGFDKPRLFIDGPGDGFERFGLPMTVRDEAIRTAGNWTLALAELYVRDPNHERFAIFQDDFITYKNLRKYLERVPYPERSYLNLYTFPENQNLAKDRMGFYPSNQCGKGAVALVFSKEAALTVLSSQHIVKRPQTQNGWRKIDGGIVEAMRGAGWTEMVHNPSLVQHVGILSSMGNLEHPSATSFRGEDFDALSLINPWHGRWKIARGATYFAVNPNGTCTKPPSVKGTWREKEHALELWWDDGWVDTIKDGVKTAVKDGKVVNTEAAERC